MPMWDISPNNSGASIKESPKGPTIAPRAMQAIMTGCLVYSAIVDNTRAPVKIKKNENIRSCATMNTPPCMTKLK